jgi:hypothetical protein
LGQDRLRAGGTWCSQVALAAHPDVENTMERRDFLKMSVFSASGPLAGVPYRRGTADAAMRV